MVKRKNKVNMNRSARPCESTDVASAILGTKTLTNLMILSICKVEAIERNCLQVLVAAMAAQPSLKPTPVQRKAPLSHDWSCSFA